MLLPILLALSVCEWMPRTRSRIAQSLLSILRANQHFRIVWEFCARRVRVCECSSVYECDTTEWITMRLENELRWRVKNEGMNHVVCIFHDEQMSFITNSRHRSWYQWRMATKPSWLNAKTALMTCDYECDCSSHSGEGGHCLPNGTFCFHCSHCARLTERMCCVYLVVASARSLYLIFYTWTMCGVRKHNL